MSKLVELLTEKEKYTYARLDNVRKQSDTEATVRQEVAVNFFDSLNTLETAKVQKEFTVDEANNALSTTGISKAVAAKNTKFTGDPTVSGDGALGKYAKLRQDSKLIYIGGVNTGKLVQKYWSPDSDSSATPNSSYKQKNAAAPGIVLGYP
jgi:hypothetical protein